MIAEGDTTPVIITITIGGVALVTVIGLLIKYLVDKKNGGKD